MITISKLNDVYLKLDCEKAIALELFEFFSFLVPNASYIPSVRAKMWDGRVKLFNIRSGKIYVGLLPYITTLARKRGWPISITYNTNNTSCLKSSEIKFLTNLSLPYPLRHYQAETIANALMKRRTLILSPTASGKSLVIYALLRTIYSETQSSSLLIVPTTNLVEQMYSDFKEYAKLDAKWKVGANCHRIYGGTTRITSKPITIATWQSIHRLPRKWFEKYRTVVGDEAHGFQAKSLTNIMTKLVNCPYRIGLTGSLDETECHRLVLEGHFGTVYRSATTMALIEQGYLALLDIDCIIFKYNASITRSLCGLSYQDEIKFIIGNKKRNEFIRDLALNLKGNTLLLYLRVDTHGKLLVGLIENKLKQSKRKVFFIFGGTPAETRESIRAITERESNAIIVASYGTFSTGINIRNLHNIIFAAPFKSRIRNLQSIGRGLRLGNKKTKARVFDLADDFGNNNYTIRHYRKRIKLYESEGFNYTLKWVKL